MRRVFIILISFCFMTDLAAQGMAFGIKGGPLLGFQRGQGAQASALISYHGIAYIESLPPGNEYAFFLQAGYHKRGSARQRLNFNGFSTNNIIPRGYEFSNAVLAAGLKKKYNWRDRKTYYAIGFRGEYNINNNLEDFQNITFVNGQTSFNSSIQYPFPEGVNKLTYGIMLGGGIEFEFTELVGGLIEFSVNPDLGPQYDAPAIPNVLDPFTGNTITIPERRFLNTTFEITFGLRFLRIVEYVD